MWYRSVLAQIFLDQQIAPFQMSKQDMLPDLEEMLTKMGKTTDEYYRMTKDQQQEIWSMLSSGSGTNLNNGFEDQDTSGFNGMEDARHSTYHDKNMMNMEQRLEDARHEHTDVYPGKLNENIRGVEQIRGTYQERSRKTEPRIFGNLPSNISLI
jgi:hypothetical protein